MRALNRPKAANTAEWFVTPGDPSKRSSPRRWHEEWIFMKSLVSGDSIQDDASHGPYLDGDVNGIIVHYLYPLVYNFFFYINNFNEEKESVVNTRKNILNDSRKIKKKIKYQKSLN